MQKVSERSGQALAKLAFVLTTVLALTACEDEPPEIADWEQFVAACSSCSPCQSDDDWLCVKQDETWCRPLCPDANGFAWQENHETHVCRCPDSGKFWSYDILDSQLAADESKEDLEARVAAKENQRQTN